MVGGNILADLTNDLLLMNVQLHSLQRSRPILSRRSGHASRDLRMRIARSRKRINITFIIVALIIRSW